MISQPKMVSQPWNRMESHLHIRTRLLSKKYNIVDHSQKQQYQKQQEGQEKELKAQGRNEWRPLQWNGMLKERLG
jgi:hypothetical protein